MQEQKLPTKAHQKVSVSITVTEVYIWIRLFKVTAVASAWWLFSWAL